MLKLLKSKLINAISLYKQEKTNVIGIDHCIPKLHKIRYILVNTHGFIYSRNILQIFKMVKFYLIKHVYDYHYKLVISDGSRID